MAEITAETVRCIEEAFARKEDFPLTMWETVQLARAWQIAQAMLEAPPDCRTEEEKRAYAFGWFKAMEKVRKETK